MAGPRPLKILQLKEGSVEVEILRANLEIVSANLRDSGARVVSIISVMGAYRTGKSFLLGLLLRYLRRRIALQRLEEERRAALALQAEMAGEEPPTEQPPQPEEVPAPEASAQAAAWSFGDEHAPRLPVPAWLLEGDAARLSEGSKVDDNNEAFHEGSFAWRPGKDRCTQGIWLWSHPFVFKDKAGRNVGVLLMDTQGAYDDKMAKAQSSTIFGLTALLSSKLIYNIQNRVEEDKLDNLDYFTTFAQTVTRDLPGGEAPFGHLELLVRDWANFEDGFTVDDCLAQMKDHQADHLDPANVPDDAKPRVERLASTFKGIGCYGLPHPGLKVTKPVYKGELDLIGGDFMHLLDVFVERFFGGDFPRPSAPLGVEITVGSFQQVVMNFAEAFRENAQEMAIGLREAFVKVEMISAREDVLGRFKEALGRLAPESSVVCPVKLQKDVHKILESHKAEFENKLKPWRLKDSDEYTHVNDFFNVIRDAARIRVLQNEQQVEGATMKLVASPVVGCSAYFLLVHQWLAIILMGIGGYCEAKKWASRNEVEMYDPSVANGVYEDVKKFVSQRYMDLQAMQVAINRCTPDEAVSTLREASKQAAKFAVTAASGAGITTNGGSSSNGAGEQK